MTLKLVFSLLATALTLVAFLPYINSILKGATRPHVFSWIIWGSTTFLVFIAQLVADGGLGAWPIGISGTISLAIAVLAITTNSNNANKQSDSSLNSGADLSITRSDWLFLFLAMSSLPIWYFTADPLGAVIVLTVADLLGFGPTVRKTYHFPHSESATFFSLFAIRNSLAIAALESYSLTTVLFPAAVSLACLSLLAMMYWRRQSLSI